jgi:hypothetical protein
MQAPRSLSLRASVTASIAAAVLVLGASCARDAASAGAGASASDLPRAGEPTAEEQSCWKDSECTLVEDCCGCGAGGLRMSVREDRIGEVTDRSAAVCEQRSCPGQPSQHRSCSATAARCAGGRCIPAL